MARWYFAGLALSFFGTSAMYLVAGIWVKTLTGSDALATVALLCVYAPGVLSPWIGRIADSYRRRPLLICTNVAMVPVLAVLFFTDDVRVIFAVLLARCSWRCSRRTSSPGSTACGCHSKNA